MPRYDVPKAAPEPLRRVQLFINSIDVHNDAEWLPEWLRKHDLEKELDRARELREALRALALANNGIPVPPPVLETLNRAGRRIDVAFDAEGRLEFRTDGDALDAILGIAFQAMLESNWGRLKACRNCHWAFYDYSPNRSATWCSMQLCGNRTKTRAYRRRRRAGQAEAPNR